MKHRKNLLLVAALLLQSAAFAQINPLLKYLPDDVTTVVHFDVQRMGSKIPGDVFRQSSLYRQMLKNPDENFSKFLSQPETAGIDFSAGIILAIKYQGKDRYDREQPIIHLLVKLKNAETFTNTIKGLIKDEPDMIKVYGTDRIIATEGKMTAGWNNDVFVITTGYSQEITDEIYKYHNFVDTIALNDTATRPHFDFEGMMERFKKSQRDLCFQLLAPKNSSSLNSNTHFTTAMNNDADIKMWNSGNSNPFTENIFPMTGMLSKLQSFSGTNKTALISFEDGKIVVKSRNFPEGTVADIYKKYPAPSQNMDLVRRLPQGTLMGLMNMSFNQGMANELLLKTGLLEMLDSIKNEIPFDISLIPGVFKSNMMLAVVKSDITTTTDPTTSKMEGFLLILAMPIADKAKFEELKSAIMPAWDSLKTSKATMFREAMPYAKNNDELLVLSLSPEVAEAFLNNPGTGQVPEWLQAYGKYPMVLNINMREMLAMSLGKNRPEKNDINKNETAILNKFGHIIAYGGEYENEGINSTIEFRFSNESENSLKQLFEMANESAEKNEEVIISEGKQEAAGNEKMKIESIEIKEIKQEENKIEPPPPPPPPVKSPKEIPVKKKKVQ